MTPRTPHLLPLITLAIATALLAPRPLPAEPPATPCALLSPLQVKAVLGGKPDAPLLTGKPGSPSDGTTDCTWPDPQGETRVYLSLKEPGIEYKSFRDAMLATGRLVPVPDLGSDAFYISSPGNSAALYVLNGKKLLLVTVDGAGFTKAENESAEKILATAILPKL